jgi:hypothetical protein
MTAAARAAAAIGVLVAVTATGAAAAAASTTTLTSGGLSLRVDASSTFSLAVDGAPWLAGGRTSIPVRGALSDAPDWLVQVAPPSAPTRGADAWGAFTKIAFFWGAAPGADAQLVTSVRAYADSAAGRELLVFAQQWPGGWAGIGANGTRDAARDVAAAHYPTFFTNASGAPDINVLQWSGCQMNAPGAFRWNGASPPPGDDQTTAIPLLLYSASGRATVIAPASNWMLAVHDHSLGGPGFGAGVKASVATLPPGFAHETIVVGGAAPGAAMDNLGDALRALSGKPRTDAYADFVLSHLGHWNDYGGYYYHTTTGFPNHEEAMLAVQARAKNLSIPLRYFQWGEAVAVRCDAPNQRPIAHSPSRRAPSPPAAATQTTGSLLRITTSRERYIGGPAPRFPRE